MNDDGESQSSGIIRHHQAPDLGDEREPWKNDAACKGEPADLFFPGSSINVGAEVRRMCGLCPVRETCLEYALDNDLRHGVWGGLSVRQRRILQRQRKAAL